MKARYVVFLCVSVAAFLLMPELVEARGFSGRSHAGRGFGSGHVRGVRGGGRGGNHANHFTARHFDGLVVNNWNAYVAESDARSGRTRARILAVQRSLAAQGFYNGPRDGVLDARTRVAIQRFQGSEDLPANGAVDDSLLNALGLQP